LAAIHLFLNDDLPVQEYQSLVQKTIGMVVDVQESRLRELLIDHESEIESAQYLNNTLDVIPAAKKYVEKFHKDLLGWFEN